MLVGFFIQYIYIYVYIYISYGYSKRSAQLLIVENPLNMMNNEIMLWNLLLAESNRDERYKGWKVVQALAFELMKIVSLKHNISRSQAHNIKFKSLKKNSFTNETPQKKHQKVRGGSSSS